MNPAATGGNHVITMKRLFYNRRIVIHLVSTHTLSIGEMNRNVKIIFDCQVRVTCSHRDR